MPYTAGLCRVVLLCFLAVAAPSFCQSEAPVNVDPRIWIDQLGYRPQDLKLARFTGQETPFSLVNESGKAVFSGTSTVAVFDPLSGESLRTFDFSGFTQAGVYHLAIPTGGRSPDFIIADDVYQKLTLASLQMLTYQRCGTESGKNLDSDFYHAACHLGKAEIWGTSKTLKAEGGWHDAGDYGKYVVPGAIAVGHLLFAWDLGAKVPGLLEEARFELEWLLRMQDAGSGGVYHKLTSRSFPGMDVSPDYDLTTMVVSPISYTATADFGAVMGMASRIWKTTDPSFAKKCLAAARKAQGWISAHPFIPFTNPAGITTGEYGDSVGRDEALWLSVEMLRATGEKAFATAVKKAVDSFGLRADSFGWADTGMFSVAGVLASDERLIDASVRQQAELVLSARAGQLLSIAKASPSGTMLRASDFHWGSNMTVLDQAMILITASKWKLISDVAPVLENLHYLLGSNPMGVSYVTGFGSNPVKNPHHRPSIAAGVFRPIAGMLSGGPNADLQDSLAKNSLVGQPPAKAFLDDSGSYSTNEVAVYWNTPLVFVLALLGQPDGGL